MPNIVVKQRCFLPPPHPPPNIPHLYVDALETHILPLAIEYSPCILEHNKILSSILMCCNKCHYINRSSIKINILMLRIISYWHEALRPLYISFRPYTNIVSDTKYHKWCSRMMTLWKWQNIGWYCPKWLEVIPKCGVASFRREHNALGGKFSRSEFVPSLGFLKLLVSSQIIFLSSIYMQETTLRDKCLKLQSLCTGVTQKDYTF